MEPDPFTSLPQELFSGQSSLDSEKMMSTTQLALELDDTPMPDQPHTLEEFALNHFNPPPKRTLSKTLASSMKRKYKDIPWAFSKEPIKVKVLLGHFNYVN